MELNRELIIKALERDIRISIDLHYDCPRITYSKLREALALINSQEQKIFELENRLKECENGYEGTLFLDRCKLHDAEEKVKELTEENERLRAENVDCKLGFSLLEDAFQRLEKINKQIEADTVRDMQERLDKHFCHDPAFLGVEQRIIMGVIDQIAKEMLEGINE